MKVVVVIALIAICIILFPAIVSAIVWVYKWIISIKLVTWVIVLVVSVILYLIWN